MMQFGGFIESKIIFTVNCHLAYISENIKFLDCDSPLFHEENPIIGGLEYQKNICKIIKKLNVKFFFKKSLFI